MKQNKIQSALNKQAEQFKPKRSPRTVYVQPQKRNGRVIFVQPK